MIGCWSIMNVIRNSVGNIAVIVFSLSAIVHVATYLQSDLSQTYPQVWALFPAAIAIHIFGCIYLAAMIGVRPGPRVSYNATLARMPRWTWVMMGTFFIYILVSAAVFGLGLTVPESVDGRYIIADHGRVFEFTYDQTQLLILYRSRICSEFWMWLTLIWALYFLTSKQNTSDTNGFRVISPQTL
jgi:hypothetical protein